MGRSKLLDSKDGYSSAAEMNGKRGMEVETLILDFSLILEWEFEHVFC